MSDMDFVLGSQLEMKGRQRSRGWQYNGSDSRDFTREQVERLIRYFRANDYPHLVTAAEIFLRTCGREGYVSAINTWDGQILTWGVGFAHGKINRSLWPRLSEEVRNELHFMAPERFGPPGVRVDQAIRTDTEALASLIYVAETDPFRESVFRAMFSTFINGTLGIELQGIAHGERYVLDNPSLVYFASRLAHWLPAGYQMGRDLPRTVRLAQMTGSARPADGTKFIAASIRVFTENFLRGRFGEDRDGSRRVLSESIGDRFNMIAKWQNRMAQFIRQDHPFEITPRVRELVPGFSRPEPPFFEIHSDWRSIPQGRLILSERTGGRTSYIDVGPR